ncbi:MAG: hypothetical protein OXT67_03955 [Zetaproteobacteria bacterium]|nr:hypothetical protein [Zetaproteobacteria bacterium]
MLAWQRLFMLLCLSLATYAHSQTIHRLDSVDPRTYYRIVNKSLANSGYPADLSLSRKYFIKYAQNGDSSHAVGANLWKIIKSGDHYILKNKAEPIYLTVDEKGTVKSSRYDSLHTEVLLKANPNFNGFHVIFRDTSAHEWSRYLTYWQTHYSWSKVHSKADKNSLFDLIPTPVDKTDEESKKYQQLNSELSKYSIPKRFFRIQNNSLISSRSGSFLAVRHSDMSLYYGHSSNGTAIATDKLVDLDQIQYGEDLWYVLPAPDAPKGHVFKNVATDLYIAIDAKGYLRLDHKLTPASYVDLNKDFDPAVVARMDKTLSGCDITFTGCGDVRYAYHLTYSSRNCSNPTTRAKSGKWSQYNLHSADDFDHVRQRYDEILYERSIGSSIIERYNAYVNVIKELMKVAETYEGQMKSFQAANLAGATVGAGGAVAGTVGLVLAACLTGPAAPVVIGVGTGMSLVGSGVGLATTASKGLVEKRRTNDIHQALLQINLQDQRFKDHFNLLMGKDLRYGLNFRGMKNATLDAKKMYTLSYNMAKVIPDTIAAVQDARAEEAAIATRNRELELQQPGETETTVEELTTRVADKTREILAETTGEKVAETLISTEVEEMLGKMGERLAQEMSTASMELAGEACGAAFSALFAGVRIYAVVKASKELASNNPGAAVMVIYHLIHSLKKTIAEMEQAIIDYEVYVTCDEQERILFGQAQKTAHSFAWRQQLEKIEETLGYTERDRSPQQSRPEVQTTSSKLNTVSFEEGEQVAFQVKSTHRFISIEMSHNTYRGGVIRKQESILLREGLYSDADLIVQTAPDSQAIYLKSNQKENYYLAMRPDGTFYLTENKDTWGQFVILQDEQEENWKIYSPTHQRYLSWVSDHKLSSTPKSHPLSTQFLMYRMHTANSAPHTTPAAFQGGERVAFQIMGQFMYPFIPLDPKDDAYKSPKLYRTLNVAKNTFTVETIPGSDAVYLECYDGKHYVGMRPDGTLYLSENKDTWEQFSILKDERNTWNIYSPTHERYLKGHRYEPPFQKNKLNPEIIYRLVTTTTRSDNWETRFFMYKIDLPKSAATK